MYKVYFAKDALDCDIWTRWWKHADVPTDKKARSLERSELWGRIEPYLRGRGRILEAGCGLGEWVRFFSMKGFEAIGVENCAPAIDKARRSYPAMEFVQADIRNMGFQDGWFDAVVSYGVLEHFEEGAEPQLREHIRVLKPGGHLVVTVPYHNRWTRLIGRYPDGGCGDGNGRSLRPGLPRRTLSERDLKSSEGGLGTISGLPVYEEAAVFHQYLFHEQDLARLLARVPNLEVLHLRPFAVRPGALLPIALSGWILYRTTFFRRVLLMIEKLLAPLLPEHWFGTMLLAVVRKSPAEVNQPLSHQPLEK